MDTDNHILGDSALHQRLCLITDILGNGIPLVQSRPIRLSAPMSNAPSGLGPGLCRSRIT